MARSIPEGWDVEIDYAVNGQEALDKIVQGKGEILFLDLNMPVLDGYQTMLGVGGMRLSGGQMQRVALARAFLRNPDILILDEATSQIDLESEQLIHRALGKFLVDRTGVMITHRPSSLAMADRIVVIEAGRVADSGQHADLIVRNRFYQSLCGGDWRATA